MMAALDTYAWVVATIVIAIGAIVTMFMWQNRRKSGFKRDDMLQTIGITLVILGIIFGENRLIGYSFIGIGILVSITSLIVRRRQVSKS